MPDLVVDGPHRQSAGLDGRQRAERRQGSRERRAARPARRPRQLALLILLLSAGCTEQAEVVPTEGLKVWIAQSVSGHTITSLTDDPLPGITVAFRAGLARNSTFEIARDASDIDGRFEMLAAGSPRGDAGYWRFIIDEDQPVDDNGSLTVYCELRAIDGDSVRAYPFELTRHPSRDLPDPLPTYFIERTIRIPWRY